MSVTLELRDGEFVISNNGDEVVLTEGELRDLNMQIDELWFECDVRNHIATKGWIFKEETVKDIVGTYCHLRHKNDGDSEGMTWEECLMEAFEGHEYGDKLTNYMWEELKEKIIVNTEHIADFLDISESDAAEIPKDELVKQLDEYKEKFEDIDLMEWYTDLVVE